jgi:serine/threonine protein kinase
MRALVQKIFRNKLNYYKYVIKWDKQLGEGAYATVYEACSRKDGCNYVAKVYAPRDEQKNRSLREVEFTNIAANAGLAPCVHHSFTKDGKFHMIMDKVPGQSLFLSMTKNKVDRPLIYGKVVDAVKHLHTLGIEHCDLHPGNILVEKMLHKDLQQYKVTLIDFGEAKYNKGIMKSDLKHLETLRIFSLVKS